MLDSTHESVHFLSLMSNYIKPGDISNTFNNLSNILIDLCNNDGNRDISQFLFYFLRLCDNSNVKLSKSVIHDAINKCQNEKCKQMLNQYIEGKNYQ